MDRPICLYFGGCLNGLMNSAANPQRQQRQPKWPWIVCALLGLILGIVSALAVSGGALSKGHVKVGRWSSDPSVGAKAADPWLRARIARVGLLALTKEETIYFDRQTDDDGNPLREACTYRLSGVAIPARWWSMTIYGADQMLPRNTDRASSIDATRALSDGNAAWEGTLSAVKPAGDKLWLSSKAGGTFSITLRLYNPETTQPEELAKLAFPSVSRVSCDGEVVKGAK
jgi:hypothetical protein